MGDVRRNRKSYKVKQKGNVIPLKNEPPGYTFSISGHDFSFDEYRRCDDKEQDIGWAFARAFWFRRNEVNPDTQEGVHGLLQRFFDFLDENHPDVTRIDQVTTELAEDYSFYLKYLAGMKGHAAHTRKVLKDNSRRKIWGAFRTLMERLHVEGIAREDLFLRWDVFKGIDKGDPFKPFSQLERAAIVKACVKEIERVRAGEKIYANAYIADFLPYAFLISLRSGANPEVLFALPVTSMCLKKGYLPGTERLILPIKNRSGYSQNITFDEAPESVRIKSRVADLIREVEEMTQPYRDALPDDHRLKHMLWVTYDSVPGHETYRLLNERVYAATIESFVKRHGLKDDFGNPLNLNFKRFRPTFAEAMLKVSGGDIRDVQKRLNHKNIRTTFRYLDPDLEERKTAFRFAGKTMQEWAIGKGGKPDVKSVAAKLEVSESESEQLIEGDFDMGVSKCKNPFNSPLPGQEKGQLCTNFLGCFRCGNMIVLKEDAYRLFSFYFWLLDKKKSMSSSKWSRAYQWIIDVIDFDIAPQLGDEVWIEEQKRKAQNEPFPLWRLTDDVAPQPVTGGVTFSTVSLDFVGDAL